ncbi:MAG: glycosyltransferase family 1 protein [Polyangiaceae bacterium]|nr:glycosyltransferase family 1 protein [Polyangiaceae bacterium]
MRIAIIAPGSRGDIQPYVPLGVGLVRAGHSVRVVTNVDHGALVKSYGLELWSMDIDVQSALQSDKVSASLESGSHIASFRQLAEIAKRGTRLLLDVGLAACKDVDVVVTGITGAFMAEGFAKHYGVPLVQAFNVPLTSTTEYPGALMPGLSWGPSIRRISHAITRQGMWMMMRAMANGVRQEKLGMPKAPLFVSGRQSGIVPGPVLYGFSAEVLPRSSDWGDDIEITGYWFADEPEGWAPPRELEAFLAAGPKPICIGFGSMSQRDPEATTRLVLDAIARSGQRAILIAGWGGLQVNERPEHVFQVDSIHHSWLYPRMAAVVHHGGAGTTSAGLRAGVPSIVVPFHGDQPFWGKRVHDLGAGPAPVARNRLTAERLAKAIDVAVHDKAMAVRAAELGARIRKENGVMRAVAAIERIAKGREQRELRTV